VRRLVEGNIQDVVDTVFVDSISESDNNVFASLAHDDMSRSRIFLTTSSRESSLSLFKILILHVQSRLLKKVWTRFVCRIEMLKKLRSCMSRILSNFRSTRVRASIRRWQNVCQYATRRLREIDLGVKMFARNFSLFRLKTMRSALNKWLTKVHEASRINARTSGHTITFELSLLDVNISDFDLHKRALLCSRLALVAELAASSKIAVDVLDMMAGSVNLSIRLRGFSDANGTAAVSSV